jgi:hypothetical protein
MRTCGHASLACVELNLPAAVFLSAAVCPFLDRSLFLSVSPPLPLFCLASHFLVMPISCNAEQKATSLCMGKVAALQVDLHRRRSLRLRFMYLVATTVTKQSVSPNCVLHGTQYDHCNQRSVSPNCVLPGIQYGHCNQRSVSPNCMLQGIQYASTVRYFLHDGVVMCVRIPCWAVCVPPPFNPGVCGCVLW